jgi:ribonuclease J
MTEVFQEPGKSNLVYASGQNIDRIVSLYKACIKAHKTLVVDVYSATVLNTLRSYAKLPYPSDSYKLKVIFPKYTCDRLVRLNKKDIMYQFHDFKITKEEIAEHPDEYVILIRPSMQFDLEHIPNLDGGNLIYSLWKGYLEKPSTKKLVDYLKQRNFNIQHIHTSGHADPETLKQMTAALNPKVIIPIHTFHGDKYKNQFAFPVRELRDKEKYEL